MYPQQSQQLQPGQQATSVQQQQAPQYAMPPQYMMHPQGQAPPAGMMPPNQFNYYPNNFYYQQPMMVAANPNGPGYFNSMYPPGAAPQPPGAGGGTGMMDYQNGNMYMTQQQAGAVPGAQAPPGMMMPHHLMQQIPHQQHPPNDLTAKAKIVSSTDSPAKNNKLNGPSSTPKSKKSKTKSNENGTLVNGTNGSSEDSRMSTSSPFIASSDDNGYSDSKSAKKPAKPRVKKQQSQSSLNNDDQSASSGGAALNSNENSQVNSTNNSGSTHNSTTNNVNSSSAANTNNNNENSNSSSSMSQHDNKSTFNFSMNSVKSPKPNTDNEQGSSPASNKKSSKSSSKKQLKEGETAGEDHTDEIIACVAAQAVASAASATIAAVTSSSAAATHHDDTNSSIASSTSTSASSNTKASSSNSHSSISSSTESSKIPINQTTASNTTTTTSMVVSQPDTVAEPSSSQVKSEMLPPSSSQSSQPLQTNTSSQNPSSLTETTNSDEKPESLKDVIKSEASRPDHHEDTTEDNEDDEDDTTLNNNDDEDVSNMSNSNDFGSHSAVTGLITTTPTSYASRGYSSADILNKIGNMDSADQNRQEFCTRLLKIWEEYGISMRQMPNVCKQTLDLYKLYTLVVKERGGYNVCSKQKLWRNVSILLNPGWSSASAALNVRRKYISLGVFHYECRFDMNGVDPLPLIAEIERSMQANKRPSSSSRTNNGDQQPSTPSSSSSNTALGNGNTANMTPSKKIKKIKDGKGKNGSTTPTSSHPGSTQLPVSASPGLQQPQPGAMMNPMMMMTPVSQGAPGAYPTPGGEFQHQQQIHSMPYAANYYAAAQQQQQPGQPRPPGYPVAGGYPNQSGQAQPQGAYPPVMVPAPNTAGGVVYQQQPQQIQRIYNPAVAPSSQSTPASANSTPNPNDLMYNQQQQQRYPSTATPQQVNSAQQASQQPQQANMYQPYQQQSNNQPPNATNAQFPHHQTPYPNSRDALNQSQTSNTAPNTSAAANPVLASRLASSSNQNLMQSPSTSNTSNNVVAPNTPNALGTPIRHNPAQSYSPSLHMSHGQHKPHNGPQQPPASASSSQHPPGYFHPSSQPMLHHTQHHHHSQHQQYHPMPSVSQQGPQIMSHSVPTPSRREIAFPPDSVEASQPVEIKKRKITSKDIGPCDPWRLYMSLKSGLLAESTWAIDALNILLYDDSTIAYFHLKHFPGLVNILLEHFLKCLKLIFSSHRKSSNSEEADLFDDLYINDFPYPTETEEASDQDENGHTNDIVNETNHTVNGNHDMDIDSELDRVKQAKKSVKMNGFHSENHNNQQEVNNNNKHHLLKITFNEREMRSRHALLIREAEEAVRVCDSAKFYNEEWASYSRGVLAKYETNRQHDDLELRDKIKKPKANELNDYIHTNFNSGGENSDIITLNKLFYGKFYKDKVIFCKEEQEKKARVETTTKKSIKKEAKRASDSSDPNAEFVKRHRDNEEKSCDKFKKEYNDTDTSISNTNQTSVFRIVSQYHLELMNRCAALSICLRNLSFVPGNDNILAKNAALLKILSRLILLKHEHKLDTRSSRPSNPDDSEQETSDLDDTDSEEDEFFSPGCFLNKETSCVKHLNRKNIVYGTNSEESEESLTEDPEWWWECVHLLRENTLVTLANIATAINLNHSQLDERCVELLSHGLVHWTICRSPDAHDPLATLPDTSLLSPQRLSIEILGKLTAREINTDLILACVSFTKPYLYSLISILCNEWLARRDDQCMRELALVLISAMAKSDQFLACRSIAKQGVSHLIGFLEDFEEQVRVYRLLNPNFQHQIMMCGAGQSSSSSTSSSMSSNNSISQGVYYNMAGEMCTLSNLNEESLSTTVEMLRRCAQCLLALAVHGDSTCITQLKRHENRLLELATSNFTDYRVSHILAECLFYSTDPDANTKNSYANKIIR